ncbi:MAG: undecaprenyldiphospho-muramoylpentapeptide beta-N-acetylglucosaminyltransferase [Candidatus Marinimicrobia bacterium]|jgi:UDP-N-acetylglucosamine--N-acetylmuramyl-(pentapeptide) pyrophosphoryl-undecaprenol N-acetylglucosamine transferase|nr:undecaprenyldiphospho-muramoylpentapeptide beta-N-acetylglucosaminyltransferase [Candidatus Neomarinimicrobiota bacterium]MBT3501523.1 undecaprenyldiphospho-muramoylpentapeptide beta-N-acetylglucosaminyltransferase [Candidatus Neomarinimicrobiota bacterium]MBT3840201.1 undecaprenyldiphospho-muramoylpentapeptide beta-N-acetylglucosaminyltransferase [Candidatus Neomarinimicrobiota bacterium]MBT3999869.1 undecaprenyldiphospho-muramoylpentapeptide beta-N-acetylglucosaminyltransferase [Candidatus 
MAHRKILIAGGGTGGHLFPALAIGEEILRRDPNAIIHYVGSKFGLEARVFPIKDVWHTLLPIRGLQRGLSLQSLGRNILLPGRIIKSMLKIKSLMKEFLPQVVVGTGGYASALPLYIASKNNSPLPIVLQEQNSIPGMTTRWFSERAKSICIAFDEANEALEENTILTGNPVRQGIADGNRDNGIKEFKLKKDHQTIFLFGGSQGSAYLNKMLNKVVDNIAGAGLQVLWQTGDSDYNKYKHRDSKNIRVVPFIHNMADAYAMADLIISRSGALTLAEITVCGKPSILVPFPSAAADHQTKNAQSLVNAGAARILFEKTLNTQDFFHSIMNLIHDKPELEKMGKASKNLGRPHATQEIVDYIFEAAV